MVESNGIYVFVHLFGWMGMFCIMCNEPPKSEGQREGAPSAGYGIRVVFGGWLVGMLWHSLPFTRVPEDTLSIHPSVERKTFSKSVSAQKERSRVLWVEKALSFQLSKISHTTEKVSRNPCRCSRGYRHRVFIVCVHKVEKIV